MEDFLTYYQSDGIRIGHMKPSPKHKRISIDVFMPKAPVVYFDRCATEGIRKLFNR